MRVFGDMYLHPHVLLLNIDILFACVKCFEICWTLKLWVMIPANFSVGYERGLFTDCVITLLMPSLGGSGQPYLTNRALGTDVKITEGDVLCLDK